jgi:hypothetical protein
MSSIFCRDKFPNWRRCAPEISSLSPGRPADNSRSSFDRSRWSRAYSSIRAPVRLKPPVGDFQNGVFGSGSVNARSRAS